MEEILALALDDSDHWVSTVAEVLQTFPENGALKLDLDENNVAFAEILTDLKKVGKYHWLFFFFKARFFFF